MKNTWLKISLVNLLVIALLGLFLRWFMVAPPEGFNYKNLLHAHSHVALLGWLYAAFFVALVSTYLPPQIAGGKPYRRLFWLSQAAVLGMLGSFPVQGYGLYSIAFSTAHLLLSYWFIYRFLADVRRVGEVRQQHPPSFRFVQAALFFLALSSLGPWSLGPVMASGGSGSPLYFNAIYFYLHFQYNGWFSFAALGLLFRVLEGQALPFSRARAKIIFHLFFWSCLPAFLLSVLWIKPPAAVYYLAGAAALGQVLATALLLHLLLRHRKSLLALFTGWSRLLAGFSLLALVLKTGMQLATALPYMADLAYSVRNFIIGYLHLVLIGFISFFLLAYFIRQGDLDASRKTSRWGLGIFLAGFLLTEGLLFLQGFLFWQNLGLLPAYFQVLFWLSTLLPLGIILFLLGQRRRAAKPERRELEVSGRSGNGV
ncbi:MAG: hypothetical protein ACO1O1_07740 [Adhaeribacter sp.]